MSDLRLWHRAELGKLRQDMEELFDSFVRDFCSPFDLRLLRCEPDVRVTTEGGNVIVTAHVPNLDPETIRVVVSGKRLSISGERVEESRGERSLSISRQGFTSTVRLPGPVDAGKVTAGYAGGMLRIVLPKCAACTPVQVSAEEHNNERGGNE
jgi:HSP20 family protein